MTTNLKDYQPPKDLLKDKIILVTGAGSGLGQAAATSYALHGATLILMGRRRHALQETANTIQEMGGKQPMIYPMDLNSINPVDYQSFADHCSEHYQQLDGVLHNASQLGEIAPIASSNVALWFSVMQVNINAAYLLTRELLPLLGQANSASLIFTSSGVAKVGRAYWGAYSVSKFATEGLMQILADELENTTAIRVNSIDPGAVNTAMRRSAYPAEDPQSNPSPQEVMGVYLYLMGADSANVNGQSLHARH